MKAWIICKSLCYRTLLDLATEHGIAQAQTHFSISSLTKPPEAGTKINLKDIQALRLGVFTSKIQRHYLAAQITPLKFSSMI